MSTLASFSDTVLEVSDFIALVNQTFQLAYPLVTIRGEVANFKVSKNKWLYFDLKDETGMVHFFGSIYQLTTPVEDGMLLRVRGMPRLHSQYGFSVTISNLQPEGEGSIRRTAEILRQQLQSEGLFDEARKRLLPYPPVTIGLITSIGSAAYSDFIKVLNARWHGVSIECVDVQVQGEAAPQQIVAAIDYLGQLSTPPDVLILTRGGGSTEDLYAFNTELVTRAIARSRIPTLVAIGHEIDTSLAELAADVRASTPSNAAELLVPHIRDVQRQLTEASSQLLRTITSVIRVNKQLLVHTENVLEQLLGHSVERSKDQLQAYTHLLEALNPRSIMSRGYAIVRLNGVTLVRRTTDVRPGDIVNIELNDGKVDAAVR